jgi:hypothetical protein
MMKTFTSFFILLFSLAVSVRAQQIENPGFEVWENAGTVVDEPVNWSSIKTSDGIYNDQAPVVWGKSDTYHSGNFSVRLANIASFVVANGVITNGRVHAEIAAGKSFIYTDLTDERWKTSLTARPEKFALWARYSPQGKDTAQIKVLLHRGAGSLPPKTENLANQVAFAQVNITGNVDSWTRFEVPFTYYSQQNPEYILIVASSGASSTPVAGSIAFLDDLELVYNTTGITNNFAERNLIYSTGNTIFLDRVPESVRRNAKIEILSLNGSKVYSAPVGSLQVELANNKYAKGLYIVRMYGPEFNYTQKIYLK